MNYTDFLSIINCEEIIIFEDDFPFEPDKSALLYGFLRINPELREVLLEDIKKIGFDIEVLIEFNNAFNEDFPEMDWEKVPEGDIWSFLKRKSNENIHQIYNAIDFTNDQDLLRYLSSYGMGITSSKAYNNIFNDYLRKDRQWKKFKIYKNYNADTEESFDNDLIRIAKGNSRVICIIDNQLNGTNCANKIIKKINDVSKDNEEENSKGLEIMATIFTSNPTSLITETAENVYIQIVEKNSKDPDENLKKAITKSAYSCILRNLKLVYLDSMNKSFNEIITNNGIAAYLSKMANFEGITNYKVVTNWFQLLFSYNLNTHDQIKDIIKLTKAIKFLDDEESYNQELEKVNTFEAFDYKVNEFHEPLAPGDVFVDGEENYYVLIGQSCDMMIGEKRDIRNGVIELLRAKIEPYKITKNKKVHQYEMGINSFKKKETDRESYTIRINYDQREFIDNSIMKLATFNKNGQCGIDLKGNLEVEVTDFIEPYLLEKYEELKKFFSSVNQLNNMDETAFRTIFDANICPRLIKLNNYNLEGGKMIYSLKRVCRINKDYSLYLNKLYLDYRGRHPFDTINLTRQQRLVAEVQSNTKVKLPFDVTLSSERNNNDSTNKLTWWVDAADLQDVLKSLKVLSTDEYLEEEHFPTICLNKTITIVKCMNDKKVEITKLNNCQVKIKKL
ncbi:hypothetical protein [Candidatus Enterococcus ferrettii]|uniref:Uncharacterized protein n=1 Tax=Candidatus Enterococcus ferrettii TaxID=2815324 RepID=A0ABV0EJS0_9ENTE|nr:hypothetical protein [Enterococcus sp. 665A]MBO1338225.1 hypothetical protein [Enterococcus sp. 665A]